MKVKCLSLLLMLLASGCVTQTVKLNDRYDGSDGQLATLSMPLAARMKIDGQDITFDHGIFVNARQIKLPPGTYNVQWEQAESHYTFVYKGSGVLKAQPGQKYQIKNDVQLGHSRLDGETTYYKHTWSQVLGHTTWIEDLETREVLVGNKLIDVAQDKVNHLESLFWAAEAANLKGDYKSAIQQYHNILDIYANSPEVSEVLNNLAWIYATCQDESLRNHAAAVSYASKACRLTSYSVPGFLDTLAAAYAAGGNFTDAKETAQKAIEIAKNQNNSEMMDVMKTRLDLFEKDKPFIEDKRVDPFPSY